jgi:hypothetical protein
MQPLSTELERFLYALVERLWNKEP